MARKDQCDPEDVECQRERLGLESQSVSGGIFWGIIMAIGLYFSISFLLQAFSNYDQERIFQISIASAIIVPILLFMNRTTRGWLFWLGAILPW